jgi:hypothetical protein
LGRGARPCACRCTSRAALPREGSDGEDAAVEHRCDRVLQPSADSAQPRRPARTRHRRCHGPFVAAPARLRTTVLGPEATPAAPDAQSAIRIGPAAASARSGVRPDGTRSRNGGFTLVRPGELGSCRQGFIAVCYQVEMPSAER